MPQFAYNAIDPQGQRLAGVLSAASEQAVIAELETRRLVPISIAHAKLSRRRKRRISGRALATSYQQLSDLLKAGVPMLRSLKLLANRRAQPALADVFRHVTESVEQGRDLADAMSDRPDVFPEVHAAMVRAGEKGGFLETVLARLGQLMSAQADLRGKVVGNLIYPALLVIFGTIASGVVFGVFVPMFRPMLSEIPRLPWITRVVLGLSDLVATWWWIGLILLAALGWAFWMVRHRPALARAVADARARLPVIGPLVRALAAARFCRMFGTMLGNGIPMLSAMRIARDAAGDPVMIEAIDRAADAVQAGKPLAGPLRESGQFDDDVIEMIDVAETSNNLDSVLLTIAETIEAKIDRLLNSAVRLIEPLLLLAIAMTVGLVAMALILPMTQFKTGL